MLQAQAPQLAATPSTENLPGSWKLQLWLWNSSIIFATPISWLFSLLSIIYLILAAIIVLVITLVGSIVGAIFGFVAVLNACEGDWDWETYEESIDFFSKSFFWLAVVLTMVPFFILKRGLDVINQISFGLIGLMIGAITSFLLLCGFTPRKFNLKDDVQRAENMRANELRLEQKMRSPVTYHYLYAKFESVVSQYWGAQSNLPNIDSRITDVALDFIDFNPNTTQCAITHQLIIPSQERMEGEPENADPGEEYKEEKEKIAVKGSNGCYYLKSELDKQHQVGRLLHISYNAFHVVPQKLYRPFIDGTTTCALTRQPLFRETAVRSIYGDYFDKNQLQAKLQQQEDICPVTGKFLTMAYVVNVDAQPKLAMPVLAKHNTWKSDIVFTLGWRCLRTKSNDVAMQPIIEMEEPGRPEPPRHPVLAG